MEGYRAEMGKKIMCTMRDEYCLKLMETLIPKSQLWPAITPGKPKLRRKIEEEELVVASHNGRIIQIKKKDNTKTWVKKLKFRDDHQLRAIMGQVEKDFGI